MKKYIIILVIAIIILALIVGVIIMRKDSIDIEVLSNENNQTMALLDIYKDFTSAFNTENYSILLDNSCYCNIVTGEEFTEENKEILRQVENIKEDSEFSLILSLEYNEKEHIITLHLNNEPYQYNKQMYTIHTEKDKIKYDRYLFHETQVFDYAN